MKKFIILVGILGALVSQFSEVNLADFSSMQKLKQWELVRTVTLKEYLGNPQDYKLVTKANPYQISLQDNKGKVFWTKNNLERYNSIIIDEDSNLFEDNDVSDDEAAHNIQDSDPEENYAWVGNIPNTWVATQMGEFVDGQGTCLLTDNRNNSFVLVDKMGTEMNLSINSDRWGLVGIALGKFLVFCTIPHFTWKNKQYVVYDMKGSNIKQFKLPDTADIEEVWEGQFYIDNNAKYWAYSWIKSENETEGYVLMTTTGKVIKSEERAVSGFWVMEPTFSEDGGLWIPDTQDEDVFNILETNTGKKVFVLKDSYGCQVAISNKAAGYLILTNRTGVQVLDYKNNQTIFRQSKQDAEYRNPWISGNGKEIRFIYQEEGKPSEVRFYRMK
jgi:hypothetical protein